jgi:two-component sensor histidine kinase
MVLLHIIEEVEQLCAMFQATEHEEQRQKLREILAMKHATMKEMIMKMKESISNITRIVNPQTRSVEEPVYTPYDI